MAKSPERRISKTLFHLGEATSPRLIRAIAHIITPQTTKRTAANIIMSGMDFESISKALYPSFIIGKSDPQSTIGTRGRSTILKIKEFFIVLNIVKCRSISSGEAPSAIENQALPFNYLTVDILLRVDEKVNKENKTLDEIETIIYN